MRRGTLSRSCSLLLTLLVCLPCFADSLSVTDQNPLLSGYGLPAPLPSRLDTSLPWLLAADFSWGNSAIAQSTAGETLIVDAETRELRFTVQHIFKSGYAVRLNMPYRTTSAGSLDGFIDDWHETFGLPEGARPSFRQDSLRLLYRTGGENVVNSRSASSGMGDVSIEVGRQIGHADNSATTAWVGVSLPTGDAEEFTGSGSLDVNATISADYRLGDRWTAFGQLGGTWLGDGDRMSKHQRDWAASATVGISARATDGLTLTLQLDGHSALFDTGELEFLGDAVMLSLGGAYRFESQWTLTLGLTEDIAAESAPDVVFLFGLTKAW
jgi:Protein of unknown function (DUF3187)